MSPIITRPLMALLLAVATNAGANNVATFHGPDECKPDPAGPTLKRSVFPDLRESNYILPFEPGKSFLVWRTTSHFNPEKNGVGLYAIDIEMPIGTPLTAKA